jgi:radical SAM protein with 4Fe4S-binding SPASM domain
MIRTFIKPLNAVLAGTSFLSSTLSGNAVVKGMPLSVGAELTNSCNLRCPECFSGSGMMSRERGFMDIDLFTEVIKELRPYIYNLNLYFQGEPMLHPHFFTFLERSRGTGTVLSTNGHFLTEENAGKLVKSHLNKLIVSVDGMDQSSYSAYRINGNLETVLNGIRNVSEALKKYPSPMKLEIQFLVNRGNEHQINIAKQFARQVHAKLILKSMQVINPSTFTKWLPSLRKFRRYESNGDGFIIKNSLPDRCARLWFNPVILWDGRVVPCCFDKDGEFIMGDLKEESFRDIWHGPRYRTFRKSLLSGRYMIDICRNCTSGMK